MNNCLTSDERLVIYTLSIKALRLDQYSGIKLKSGRMSPTFFNSGLFNTGESMNKLIDAYYSAIPKDIKYDGIFGPAYKGITLSSGLAMKKGGDVQFFYDRKELKDHGEGGQIVGGSIEGKNIFIIDDVMTGGKSVSDAHKLIEKNGGNVKGVAIAFDRQEVAADGSMSMSAVQRYEEEYGIHVYSAANLQTLINLFDKVVELSNPILQDAIIKYKNQYGVWKDTLQNKKALLIAELFYLFNFSKYSFQNSNHKSVIALLIHSHIISILSQSTSWVDSFIYK